MTIRIIDARIGIRDMTDWGRGYHVVGEGGTILATADTVEEALEAKRAFENVLAPRFTRDEAIAIVKDAMARSSETDGELIPGIRLALEALAAARAFVDTCDCEGRMGECPDTMARKLDAAGIR